jgi:hypothetical protein
VKRPERQIVRRCARGIFEHQSEDGARRELGPRIGDELEPCLAHTRPQRVVIAQECAAQRAAVGTVGINGTQGKKYEKIYKDYKAGKITRAQAEQQIAKVWGANETTSNTRQNYQKYYEKFYTKDWNKQFPGKPKTFVAP